MWCLDYQNNISLYFYPNEGIYLIGELFTSLEPLIKEIINKKIEESTEDEWINSLKFLPIFLVKRKDIKTPGAIEYARRLLLSEV